MLDLAIILSLASQCAPSVSPETLAAIAHTESRFNPLAIGVNRSTAVRQPRNRPVAVQTARRLISAGINIDLGLAQINSSNLGWLDLSIEDAFDPCRNLSSAAKVLRSDFALSSRLNDPQRALRVALSRYNTGHPERGFRNGYVARVEASARQLGLMAAGVSPSPLTTDLTPHQPAPPVVPAVTPLPADWDVFARARGNAGILFAPSSQTQTWSVRP